MNNGVRFLVVGLAITVAGCASSRSVPQPKQEIAKSEVPARDYRGPVWFDPQGKEKRGSVIKKPSFPNSDSTFGINLAATSSVGPTWPFVDVFKTAGAWISMGPAGPDKRPVNLDALGWVRQLDAGQHAVARLILPDAGSYLLIYEGTGDLILEGVPQITAPIAGRLSFNADTAERIGVRIRATDPKDPIRNIRVVLARFEDTHQKRAFRSEFLQRLKHYKVLRFAEWARVDNSSLVEWTERTTPQHAVQTGNLGVAYEHMVTLANLVHADVWIPIPHAASDGYVEALAQLLRKGLDPSLSIYIEYSSELWVAGRTQASWASLMGRRLGAGDSLDDALLRYQAHRSIEVMKIFEGVFEGRERLIGVLSSRAGDTVAQEKLFGFGGVKEHISALAIDAFLANGPAQTGNALDSIRWLEGVGLERALTRIADSAGVANKLGVETLAYAGGLYSRVRGTETVRQDAAAQRVYRALLEKWRETGGKMFVHYRDEADHEQSEGRTLLAVLESIRNEVRPGVIRIEPKDLTGITLLKIDDQPQTRDDDGAIVWQGAPGRHVVFGERADGAKSERILEVGAGETNHVRLVFPKPPRLKPEEPEIIETWWFWAAASAAAVAGGVLATVLITTGEDGPEPAGEGSASGTY